MLLVLALPFPVQAQEMSPVSTGAVPDAPAPPPILFRQQGPPQPAHHLADPDLALFERGIARDLASLAQLLRLQGLLGTLTPGQRQRLRALLDATTCEAAGVFILKAYAAGEPWDLLVQYAAEMQGMPEEEIIRRSTMRDDPDLTQQWQDACAPATVQTAAGEADPRFAWELSKLADVASIGIESALAQQQKEWLEAYGGRAVPRGETGGIGIQLQGMLNDLLPPVTGARYRATQRTNLSHALDLIAARLQAGYDVPLCFQWSYTGPADAVYHFSLALAVRGTPGDRWFLIHEVWSGRTAWVHERAIAADRLDPITDGYVHLYYYYLPEPQ